MKLRLIIALVAILGLGSSAVYATSFTAVNNTSTPKNGIFIDSVKVVDFTDIDKKVIELQAEYDNDYSRKRQAEYPSIQECVHAILDDDLVALQEKRQAIKTKYPKS